MDVTGPLTTKQIPKMGSQMILDFINVDDLVKKTLDKLQIKPIQLQSASYDDEKGLSTVALLDNGHFVAHTNWEQKTISFDFYYSIYHTHDEKLAGLKSLEVFLCDTLGWENSRQIVVIPRGYTTKIFLNYTSLYSLILQQVDFVYREKSDFGDLRVYDSAEKGMLLIQDNNLIYSEELKSRYAQDLYQNVNTDGQSLQNCLVLGGADLQIASLLLKNEGTKNIQVVEEDELTNEKVPENFNSTEFYTNIKRLLKPKGKFTQLIGKDEKVDTYKEKLGAIGFKNVNLVLSPTTSYGEELQLLIVSE